VANNPLGEPAEAAVAADIRLVQASRRLDTAKLAFSLLAILVASLSLVLIVGLLLRINDLAEQSRIRGIENARLNHQMLALAASIKDCTDPKGKCAQRGQQQTGKAVGSINDVTVAAAWCSRQTTNRTVNDLRICIANVINTRNP
jgi:hypothetical protein